MTATPLDHARHDLMRLAELVLAGRQAISAGHAVDLAPLGERTRAACAQVAALDRETARSLMPLLRALLDDLDTLEVDLSTRFGALALRHQQARAPTVAAAYQAQATAVPVKPPRRPSPATAAKPEKA